MKSQIIKYIGAGTIMAFGGMLSSCESATSMPEIGVEDGLGEVRLQFTISVGQDLETRAEGRPLDNTDAMQKVSNMRLYMFRADADTPDKNYSEFKYCRMRDESGETVNYLYIPAFEKDQTWTSTSDEMHPILLTQTLEKGYKYIFLAVGRDDIDQTGEDTGSLRQTSVSGSEGWISVNEMPTRATTLAEASMAINIRRMELQTCELFTGTSNAILVDNDHEDFVSNIILKRRVSGVLMYLENIPTHFKALANFSQPGLTPPFDQMPLITKGKEYKVTSVAIAPICISTQIGVVNGIPNGTGYPNSNFRGYFADVDLTKAQDKDGYFINTNPGDPTHPNSVLAGNFVLPISVTHAHSIIEGYPEFDHTLYLVFYTTENDLDDHTFAAPFFWYPIECVAQEYNSITGEYVDKSGTAPTANYTLNTNQVYSLGEKYGDINRPLDLSSIGTNAGSKMTSKMVLSSKTIILH